MGFTYSVACSEVEVDILTGETTILRSDIMYDMGRSLNPAVDVGQIEGAFVQGVGYVMSEALTYQSDDPSRDDFAQFTSDNTWRYKPPAATSIPLELNVHFYPRPESGRRERAVLVEGGRRTAAGARGDGVLRGEERASRVTRRARPESDLRSGRTGDGSGSAPRSGAASQRGLNRPGRVRLFRSGRTPARPASRARRSR